jgi:hypothetical protein
MVKAVAELMDPVGLGHYGALCAWALARAHARTGDPVAIAAYLGAGTAFDDAVAGKEDEGRVLSRQSVPEILQERGHLGLVGIGGKQHLEPQALQFLCNVGGIVGGINEGGDILVRGVADDQRQALVFGCD